MNQKIKKNNKTTEAHVGDIAHIIVDKARYIPESQDPGDRGAKEHDHDYSTPSQDGTKPKSAGEGASSGVKMKQELEEEPRSIDQFIWDTKQKEAEEIGARFLENQLKSIKRSKSKSFDRDLKMLRDKTEKELGKIPCGFILNNNLRVYVHSTDITKLKVGAIVNAANGHLRHGGGVARAIVDNAGDELTEHSKRVVKEMNKYNKGKGRDKGFETTDVIATNSGRLPCTMVLHAVGPIWPKSTLRKPKKEDEENCVEKLLEVFSNTLEYANLQGVESLAIPPISSGIYGVPGDIVSDNMVKALINFSKGHPDDSTLQAVHCVDINEHIISQVARLVHLSPNSQPVDEGEVKAKIEAIMEAKNSGATKKLKWNIFGLKRGKDEASSKADKDGTTCSQSTSDSNKTPDNARVIKITDSYKRYEADHKIKKAT